MEIFEGSPRERFFDVIFNASKRLCCDEIEKLLITLIAYEEICEKHGISEDEIRNFISEKLDFEDELNDKFIEITGNILSNNE